MPKVQMRDIYTGTRMAPRSTPLGGPLTKLEGLGRLTQYVGVAKLQAAGNDLIDSTHAGVNEIRCAIPESYKTDDDGRWGDETDALFARMAKWAALDRCSLAGLPNPYPGNTYEQILFQGPRAMALTLKNGSIGVRLTDSDIDDCEMAWGDFKIAKSDCARSGGTWNRATASCTPAAGGGGGGGTTPPPDDGGGGGGGDGDGEPPPFVPTPTSSGWLGPVLLIVDVVGGALLAGSSKKW